MLKRPEWRNYFGSKWKTPFGVLLWYCYCEKYDKSKPYYTPYGSFWTNSSAIFNKTTPTEDLPYKFRNRCNLNGYESVALIPLRTNNEIIGLLQLNDKRPNIFTPETIVFLEELGSMVGIAFKRIQSEIQLRENESRFRVVFESCCSWGCSYRT